MPAIAVELGRTLREGSRVVLIDPGGDGMENMILKFELTSVTGAGRDLAVIGNLNLFYPNKDAAGIRKFIGTMRMATHIVVYETLPEVVEALGVALPPNAVSLLKRSDIGWAFVNAWPYPGYTNPHNLPD